MTTRDGRRLNPCTYDPKADNSAVVNDSRYEQFQNRSSYDSGALRRFELYLDRADEKQRACFLDLIQAALTGVEWKPGRLAAEEKSEMADRITTTAKIVAGVMNGLLALRVFLVFLAKSPS